MKRVATLSETAVGQSWLAQFATGADQVAAAAMLDAMVLLDHEDIAVAQRAGLASVQAKPHRRPFIKSRIGLYAERESAEGKIFTEEWIVGRHGKRTERSTGPTRVVPIAPRRGSSRVGSEGPTANVIAQVIKGNSKSFTNHPGPNLIRKTGVGVICVVTDFIGSGTRINKMLDLFWKSPSVRSWWQLGWISFAIVAGCGTRRDERQVYLVFRSLGYGALLSFEMARLCTRLPGAYAAEPQDVGAPPTGYRFRKSGHLPQGAPTSPMLANLVVRALDRRLEAVGLKYGWVYSRYADDLAFSTKDNTGRGAAIAMIKRVEREVHDFGLRENPAKTSVTPPGSRKVLLGLLVDRDQPRLTRQYRNNVETHLFALSHPQLGPKAHCATRGFRSVTGLRRHVAGLIAFAHAVDEAYAARLYADFNKLDWSR